VIAIAVRGPNLAERGMTLEAGTLQIGRSARCEIALPGDGVTPLHARITLAHGRALLVDAGSTNGTFLNGVRISGPVALSRRDRITIGAYTLEVLSADAPPPPPPPRLSGDPTEAALLAELERAADPAPLLLVYADWLEQTGEPRRAELLRLQHELAALDPLDASIPQRRKQLRQLAADDDLGWRILVARAPIEQCPHSSTPASTSTSESTPTPAPSSTSAPAPSSPPACLAEWSRLARTDRADVRACSACGQRVFYCATLAEARGHALRGEPVAADASTGRTRGDLAPE
jgi:uncharacterized protein (TIGR02996 family)